MDDEYDKKAEQNVQWLKSCYFYVTVKDEVSGLSETIKLFFVDAPKPLISYTTDLTPTTTAERGTFYQLQPKKTYTFNLSVENAEKPTFSAVRTGTGNVYFGTEYAAADVTSFSDITKKNLNSLVNQFITSATISNGVLTITTGDKDLNSYYSSSKMDDANLNFATVITEFFAFYFYFAVSFDFKAIYTQIVKLFIDLQVIVKHVPFWIILVFVWLIFERWRKNLALAKLRRMENANRGFINDLPIVSMTCGSMGKKKTTIITDMALSQEVMFRNIAYGKLQETDMKFPKFGWIAFEMELRKCMEYGTVYNLATVKEWIKVKRARYEKHHNDLLQLYGYDSERYGLYYRDGLKTSYIFDVLSTYAQLYFIYVIQSSLIVANYSIREDNRLIDGGNFPVWSTDFFSKNPRPSRHAHILDFDILRLGKKVLENNPNAGSFEFGVVAITEVGKERGNNLELKEVKKGTEETNQKNDLFNSWLKMCRHSATVDNYPFIKVFTDEQRPSSWGADARELCDIVHIVSSGNTRLALPFFTIEDMLNEWLFDRFINLYEDFRFNRGDNTLLIYLLKKVTAFVYRRNAVIYNTYGYSISNIEKERGTMDGKTEKKKYYLMNKKIYSQRFSTDCFSDYFNDIAKNTKIGLNDYMEYQTEKATVTELKMQNSYFINALYKNADSE